MPCIFVEKVADMLEHANHLPAKVFFLDAVSGKRFCLYHAPPAGTKCLGAFIYVHPFGDEMNKARRIAAMQARAFAEMGYGVLQVDLFGCGDSSGDFADARWEIWKEDLAAARKWLDDHIKVPISLWGLRLGALLALDFAQNSQHQFERIILWQPVLNGELFLTQFLRLRLANDILAGGHGQDGGTRAMRATLAAGDTLEVAGYDIAPALADAIDTLDASTLTITKPPIHWFEIAPEAGRLPTPAVMRVTNKWTQKGSNLHMVAVQGAPFWATQEITECPELLSATTKIFDQAHA